MRTALRSVAERARGLRASSAFDGRTLRAGGSKVAARAGDWSAGRWRDPLASPVFGDYRGIPPLLIQAGDQEMLRDDSIRVAKKAAADGASVYLEVWPSMVMQNGVPASSWRRYRRPTAPFSS